MKQWMGLLIIILSGVSIAMETQTASAKQQSCTLDKTITRQIHMEYLLYLPKEYGKTKQQWPLMLFLHGAGERGNNIELVKKNGLPNLIEQGKDYEFIVVSPQCPSETTWSNLTEDLNALVDDVVGRYSTDPNRLYVTGLSMGGFGTWDLIARYPDKFAAAAPICGGGKMLSAKAITDIPIWVFHGAKDPVVPPAESEKMVQAVKNAGGKKIQLTIYPDAQHDSWTQTYDNPKLYEWFLEQKRQTKTKN